MKKEKVLGYFFTPIFVLLFFSTLLIFHPLLIISFKLFGYDLHKRVLELMNYFILAELRLAGTKFKIEMPFTLDTSRPLIIVSNHQSMFDIPLLLLGFKKHHPKFIAKKELARGLPSISFALKAMGSAIIDRKDSKGAVSEIERFANDVREQNAAACIFPEGTRARDGKLKPFKTAGVTTLVKNIPNALIIPVVISGNWQILKYNFFPVPFGVKVCLRMLEPFEIGSLDGRAITEKAEKLIAEELTSMT